MPIVASADDSRTCGDNLTWAYFSDSQTLTISGTGEMYEMSRFISSLILIQERDLLALHRGKNVIQYTFLQESYNLYKNGYLHHPLRLHLLHI